MGPAEAAPRSTAVPAAAAAVPAAAVPTAAAVPAAAAGVQPVALGSRHLAAAGPAGPTELPERPSSPADLCCTDGVPSPTNVPPAAAVHRRPACLPNSAYLPLPAGVPPTACFGPPVPAVAPVGSTAAANGRGLPPSATSLFPTPSPGPLPHIAHITTGSAGYVPARGDGGPVPPGSTAGHFPPSCGGPIRASTAGRFPPVPPGTARRLSPTWGDGPVPPGSAGDLPGNDAGNAGPVLSGGGAVCPSD